MARNHFGNIRRRPSGQYQARYRDPASGDSVSLGTFKTRAEAADALARVRVQLEAGSGVDPRRGKVLFGDYAGRWIADPPRPQRRRTREGYEDLLRLHILPTFTRVQMGKISAEQVRTWYGHLGRTTGQATRAKSYRLLRAILNTAVDEDVIGKNPARLPGAGQDGSKERPLVDPDVVLKLADAIEPPYRCMVLLAGFVGLRWGELAGLQRRHLDLLHGTLTVNQQLIVLKDGSRTFDDTKSEAGMRTLAIPPPLIAELEHHLAHYVAPGKLSLLFTAPAGGPLAHGNFGDRQWRKAKEAVGVPPGFHFHDLRHAAATMAASTGASIADLQHRLGHASARAALKYQHRAQSRDQDLADAVGGMIDDARNAPPLPPVARLWPTSPDREATDG